MTEQIKSGQFILEYDLATGKFGLRDEGSGAWIFESACACIEFSREGGGVCSCGVETQKADAADGMLFTQSYAGSPFTTELKVSPLTEADGFKLRLTIKNGGPTAVSNVDFYPLSLESVKGGALFGRGPGHDYKFLRNGFLTWSGAEVRGWNETMTQTLHPLVHNATHNSTVPVPRGRGRFIGEWFGAVRDQVSGGLIVAGFTTTADQLAQIDFKSRNGNFHFLRAVCHAENIPLAPGGELSSEELVILALPPKPAEQNVAAALDFDAPLKTYARLAAAQTQAPVSKQFPTPPVGWCSWYYYFEKMDQKVILENIDAAKSLSDKLPISVFQVDDGYQPAPGDWMKVNSRFPKGVEWMSRRILEAGYTPGLWVAPFFATHRSELYKKNKDWFVRREGGGPKAVSIWPQPASLGIKYGIDNTHPDAARWMKEIFTTIVRDWGYKYLKLDFLYAGAIDGERHDPHATRAQAFRRGLEIIREAAGPDTYIVGCGIPIALGLGIVNGMRMSGDTAPYWEDFLQSKILGHPSAPSVTGPAIMNFTRYFLNNLWGFSDADCLMCRFENTKLTHDEVLTHAAIVALSGGPLFLSDNLAELTSSSIRLAQQLIPPLVDSAVPADLFDTSPPATLVKRFDRDFDPVTIVGRFNWSEQTADLPVFFGKIGLDENTDYHVFDVWEERYHGVHRGRVVLPRVPKHASRMLSLRPVSAQPQLVATTFHFTQGGVDLVSQNYDASARRLTFSLAAPCNRDGKIYIYSPEGYTPGQCVVRGTDEAHETVLRHITGRLFRLDFVMDDRATVEIDF